MTKRTSAPTETERHEMIVALLAGADVPASDRVLLTALKSVGIRVDLDTIRQDLSTLETRGLIAIELLGVRGGEFEFYVATITPDGRKEADKIMEEAKALEEAGQ